MSGVRKKLTEVCFEGLGDIHRISSRNRNNSNLKRTKLDKQLF